MALLDNVDEPDFLLESEDQAKQKKEIEKKIETKAISLQEGIKGFDDAFKSWLKKSREDATAWSTIRPHTMKTNLPKLELMEDDSIFSSGDVTKRDVFVFGF